MTLVLQHIAVQYFLIIWVVKYGFHLVVKHYYMVLPFQGGGESPGSPTRKRCRGGMDIVQNCFGLSKKNKRLVVPYFQ